MFQPSFSLDTPSRKYFMAKQVLLDDDPLYTLQRPTVLQAANIFTNANQADFERKMSQPNFTPKDIKDY